jgi:glycosyltransferase involved in cell wall biosynthesis
VNILLFIPSLACGGAERVTANLANNWAAKGWTVSVVTLAPKDFDFYKLHPSVGRITLGLPSRKVNPLMVVARNFLRILALRKVLQRVRPDVAVAMMTDANVLLALASTAIVGLATIGSEHSHPPKRPLGRVREWLRWWSYGRLDAVTALTTKSARWMQAQTRARYVAVIPNAAPYPLTEQAPRLTPPTKTGPEKVLLAVGRLSEEKQFGLLLRVFETVAADFLHWKLVILGEGGCRAAIKRQIVSADLSSRVLLPGRVGNVGQWYEGADLYVMSSRVEGFGNTLAEAMAHGLSAVSFDCEAGPREIIRHEVDGLLVPDQDEQALEFALRRLMGGAFLRQKYAKRAIEARERFSAARICGMWEDLIDKIS